MSGETAGQVDDQLLSDREVAKRYGIARETAWRWARGGKIPKPRQSPGRGGMWLMSEIVEHLRGLKQAEQKESAT